MNLRHFDPFRIDERAVITILAVLVVTWLAGQLVVLGVRRYHGRFFPEALKSASLLATVARITIWAIGFMLVLAQLGVSIAPLITALGVGGLAVALALSPTLGNLFSGLQLLMSRQINPGDYINVQGSGEGRIVDISWRNTTILDHIGASIVVPNTQLAQATVTVYAAGGASSYPVAFTVRATADMQRLEQRLTERSKAAGAEGARLRFSALSGDNFQCVLGIKVPRGTDPFDVRDAVLRELSLILAEEKGLPST
ncbi:MAG: mechanosensitive ion channel family protein [Candidatus Eremiobacteraeota bacterium]|nr:mechanosensitive ion channel family protein [Candidatus Eremiobacteraeota bacterium]